MLITSIRSITVFFVRVFCKIVHIILSFPQNIVMILNNVMLGIHGWNYGAQEKFIIH